MCQKCRQHLQQSQKTLTTTAYKRYLRSYGSWPSTSRCLWKSVNSPSMTGVCVRLVDTSRFRRTVDDAFVLVGLHRLFRRLVGGTLTADVGSTAAVGAAAAIILPPLVLILSWLFGVSRAALPPLSLAFADASVQSASVSAMSPPAQDCIISCCRVA